jgi:hypothetical protein
MHNQSPLRRGESGKKPGRSGKGRDQALDGGGHKRHPTWDRNRPGQPSRLAALGCDPRHFGAARRAAGAGERASGPRLRFGRYPREAGGSFSARRDLQKRPVGPAQRAGMRWVVERTNSWHNAHKKLVWCTEREGRVIDFWVAFSDVVIIVRRLIREAWSRYRWESRPSRRP